LCERRRGRLIRNADAFAATRPAKAPINAVPFDKVLIKLFAWP